MNTKQLSSQKLKPGKLRVEPSKPEASSFSLAGSLPEEAEKVQQWVKAAINGDSGAFAELYRLFARQIYGYIVFRCNNSADAEDLTAQVFLKAWQAIGRYKVGETPFQSWLYRIAHNSVISYYKSGHQQTEMADAGINEFFIESIKDEKSEGSNPLENAVSNIQKEALYRAMSQLSEEQQQVLYLRFMEEWSHSRIAQLLNKKEGTVRGIQFRALEILGKLLSKESLSAIR